MLWESGGATVSGAALWTSPSLGGLEKTLKHTAKPATHLDSTHSVPSHCGKVQRSESCFLFYCNLPLSSPPKYPKVPLNHRFPTSSIFTREVTWESSCLQQGNAELVVKMLLSEPAPCLSHTSHQSLLSNYQSKIQSAPLYFGSRVTNFSTIPKTTFF